MKRNGHHNALWLTPILAAAFSAATPLCHADRLSPARGAEWFRDDGLSGTPPNVARPLAASPAAVDAPATPADAPPAPVDAPPGPIDAPVAPVDAPVAPGNANPPPATVPAPRPRQLVAPNRVPGGYLPPMNYGGNGYGNYGNSGYGNSGYGGPGYGPSDYPSNQIYNYVLARARYATASALFRQAETELSIAYRQADQRFERSPELVQALKSEKEAYQQFLDVRHKALISVVNSEQYQRLSALRDDLGERIEESRTHNGVPLDQLLSLATLKMKHATDMRAMEADALNDEPGVHEAQEKLVALGNRVAALRQRHADELRGDPDIQMARRNFDDARIARITAEAYLRGSMEAGDLALGAFYYGRTPYAGYWPNTGGGYYPYGY